MIEPIGNRRVGDVVLLESFYGFNIFALEEFIEPALKISNMIFRFTNNPVVDAQLIQGNSYFVREALMKMFFARGYKSTLTIIKNIVGLETLVWLFMVSQNLYVGDHLLLPKTVTLLRSKLFSVDSVNDLAIKEKLNSVLDVCCHELKLKLVDMNHMDEHFKQAMEFNFYLDNLVINQRE
jgi:hypothetical protein